MLKLHGFAASNYYNKVKLALLEREIPFEEVLTWTSQEPELLAKSPMGKVPFLETEQGIVVESSVILEFLEHSVSTSPLLPKDPYAAAKVRELVQFIDIHLELVARRLYPESFFGGKVSDEVKKSAYKDLVKGVRGFKQLAQFSPFVGGATLTLADCAAYTCLPGVRNTAKAIYGEDLFADVPFQEYMALMKSRASVQRLDADMKANTQVLMERIAAARAKAS